MLGMQRWVSPDPTTKAIWAEMKATLPDFGLEEVNAYDMKIVEEIAAARKAALGK